MARKTYRKTYDRENRTYRYTKNDGTNEFIVFRAGFGGCEEWTAGTVIWLDTDMLFTEALGFPNMYQAVLTFMGFDDMTEWMIDRKVA